MKIRRSVMLTVICVMWVISGCCQGKFNYKQPTVMPELPSNSVVVEKSKNDAWKDLISNMGKSFFVINNLDKESGFINVSYGGDPCNYIDCGQITIEVTNVRGKRVYDFPGCKPYIRYESVHNMGLFLNDRKMDLQGRANIIVEELSANTTKITVSVKYVVTKSHDINQLGTYRRDMLRDTISFGTNGTGMFPQGCKCAANGKFEAELLSLVR